MSPGTARASRIRANRPGSRASVAGRRSIWPVPRRHLREPDLGADRVADTVRLDVHGQLAASISGQAVARASTNIAPTVAANRGAAALPGCVAVRACHHAAARTVRRTAASATQSSHRRVVRWLLAILGTHDVHPFQRVDQTVREVLVAEVGESPSRNRLPQIR